MANRLSTSRMQAEPPLVEPATEETQAVGIAPRVRWILVLTLGTGLTALNAIWMTYMEIAWNQGYATLLSLYYNVVFTLVLVLLINGLVRRVSPAASLSRAEMLLLFVMATLGTTMAMTTEYMMSMLAYPYQYGYQEPRWQQSLLPHLSRLLTVSDPEAAKNYYQGNADLWRLSALKPWLAPFLGWGLFLAALTWTGLCLSVLVYNQWRHQEKLPFPLVQIPHAILEPRAAFYRSRLFWSGFVIAAGINILNALHRVYPQLPEIAVKAQAWKLTGLSRPWSALEVTGYSWNPLLIGLEFFLPIDMLFSIVFFYWAARLEGVALAAWGTDATGPSSEMISPYLREQAFGSVVALLLFALWTARYRWRESWRKFRPLLPVKRATRGAGIGAAIMIAVLMVAGMPAYMAVLFVGIYFLVSLSLARIRAQYGPPSAGLLMIAPNAALYSLLGRDVLGASGLSSLALTHWLGREYVNAPLAPTLESFALTERTQPSHLLPACILVGAVIGYIAAFGTALTTGYHLGQASGHVAGTQIYFGREAYALFSMRLSDHIGGFHQDSATAMVLGVMVTLLLQSLRTRFIAFPLHPVGYAVADSYISAFLWSTALVTWLFKLLLMRYAGLKGYYRAIPFFLGLILGEFLVGSLISLIGVLLGAEVYVFWPY